MFDRSAQVRIEPTGRQVIDVTVDGGYRPAVIRAMAGLPLRLVFRRLDPSECAERVVFSTPRLERHLALAGATAVDLPAQPPGEVRFTCGMGRYKGRIELSDAPRSLLGRLRQYDLRLRRP
jgi:plastocyanin domain-containing protein